MKPNQLAITGIIREHAQKQPNKTALIVNGQTVSYEEFYGKVCAAAAFLADRGVTKGTHVLTVANPNLRYFVCEYAILGLGAVNIPAENRIPTERLGEIAQLVDAKLVLSPEKPLCNVPWIPYCDVNMDGKGDFSWEPVSVSDDCSEIIFTTGTTGKSKGVMLSSRCLEAYLAAINPTFDLCSDSAFLVTTPLNHVGGLHRIHQCMAVGCTAVVLDGIKNLKGFFDAIYEYGVTHTYLPPASVKVLLTLAKKELAKLDGKLKFIYTASAPFPMVDIEKLMELLPNTRLHQGYGSSEAGSVCNCCYNAPGKTINSLGKPYPSVEVILHDADGNLITESNKEGYIRSRSAMNMLGYYKEPELTQEVLKDGFIYSKDLMYFDEEGELHFAGRGDDVINIRGFKVAPVEIEETVLRFPGVVDCACIPYNDKASDLTMKLYVVAQKGESVYMDELVSFLETKLEPYKIPRYIESLPELPKTYNGKVDRKKLIAQGN